MGIALLNQPRQISARQFLRCFFLVLCSLWTSVSIAQTSLQLPFFDDFATSAARAGSEHPDSTRWQPGSGVYINNTMGINQPTINIATFDGLQANGKPYVRNSPLEQDYTDTLASKPINLAGLSVGDNVYLSFYWQSKGLGELPDPGAIQILSPDTIQIQPGTPLGPGQTYYPGDPTRVIYIDTLIVQKADSLTLQFKDPNGVWKTVWAKPGGQADSTFNQAFVQVADPIYFYTGFAFRFRTFGKRSGPFDTWHIDYIYLNKGRSTNDKYIKDLAVRKALSPLLKRYTAMPLSQYKVKGAAEIADSVTTDINNLYTNFNLTHGSFKVYDQVSGTLFQNDSLFALVGALSSKRLSTKPASVVIANSATKALLSYEVDLQTSDNQNSIFQRDPLTLLRNDTISAVAALDNYYAYDDGAWEYAKQIRQQEQVAVRFALNKPDTIGSVRACIVPFTTDQTGQPFVITIYSNQNGKPSVALYQESFSMQYPATRNGFVDYKFTRTVIVKDTFYVGYQQITSSDTTFLRLGFDVNSPFGANIFYNGGANWEQNLQPSAPGKPLSSLQVQGAFMLRPVMGAKNAIVTATTDPEPLAPLRTYPNPTNGLIRWDNPKLTRLEVIMITGQTVLSLEPSHGQQTLDLSYLPDGLYLIRLFADQRTVVQKLIIQH